MFTNAAHIISVLIAMLYTFLALGSCAVPASPPVYAIRTEAPLPDAGERRLAILSARGEATHSLLRAANLYMLEHPGVLISVHTVGEEADYKSALRSRLLAGGRVDLFHIFGYSDMRELEGRLDDLSDLYWARQAIADTLEPVSVGEQFFGIPYSLEGMGLIVNTGIFEAAEVFLAGVDSFDTLEDAWRDLREVITLGNMRGEFPRLESVTSLPGLDDDFLGRQLADVALGGEFATAAQAAHGYFITYPNAEAMGLYVSLLARYTTHGRGWAMLAEITAREQVENGLAAERVAVIQQSVEVYHRLLAINPELEGSLRLMPIFLQGVQQGHVYTHAPVYWAVNANSSEESKALARDFLTWLYRSETGARFLAEEMGVLSPFRDTAVATANPLHGQLLNFIARGYSLPRRHREFPPGWSTNSFAAALREYFTARELTWEEVARRNIQDWAYSRMGE